MSKKHRGTWMHVPKGNQPHFGPEKVPEEKPAEEQTEENNPSQDDTKRRAGSPSRGGGRKR